MLVIFFSLSQQVNLSPFQTFPSQTSKKISKRKISKKPLINIGRVGLVALIFALLLSALKIEPAKALVGNNPIRVFGQNDNFNDTRANGVGVSGAGLNYPVQMDLDSSGVGAISG